MERMTIRGQCGIFLEPQWDFGIDPEDYDLVQEVLERLAVFEDLLEELGVEPEELIDQILNRGESDG